MDSNPTNYEQDQRLSRLQSSLLMLGLLTTAIGQSFIFAILPPLGRDVGFNEIQINAVVASSALAFSVFSAIWGRIADRIGRKPVLVIGVVGYAVGNLVFALTFQAGLAGLIGGAALFATVVVIRISQSMVMSGCNPGAAAYAADFSARSQRTKALARLGTANSLGMIAGPILAGALAGFGLLTPLYFATVLAGLAGLIIVLKLPPDKPREVSIRSGKRLSMFDERIRLYLACSFGGFTGFAGIQQTMGFRLQDMLSLSGTETAQYTAIALMSAALLTFTMQLTVAQKYQGPPIVLIRAGVGLLLSGACVVALAPTFSVVLAGMAVLGAGLGLSVPAIAAAASLAVNPDEQGAAAGLITALPAAGFVTGPLLCGYLYTVSPTLSALGAAAVLLPVFIVTLLAPKLPRYQ